MYKSYYIINGKPVPLIQGGKGGCFAAGTLIDVPGGARAIELIQVGDLVTSFGEDGAVTSNKVTHIFEHEDDEILEVKYWNGSFDITPNHWVLNEYMAFTAIGNLKVDDVLVDRLGYFRPILSINKKPNARVYNLTIDNDHTYIANGIRVHNKGGKKGASAAPAVEAPNSLFSTDLFFGTLGFGEGPIYRINPNGPQDIEFNESSIDDLVKLDSDGTVNTELFFTASSTGTVTGKGLPSSLGRFAGRTVTPQGFNSPVSLKKGNLESIPAIAVTQNTSQNSWDSLEFNFLVSGLQRMDDQGNVFGYSVGVKITVFEHTGTTVLKDENGVELIVEKTIEGKTNTNYKFSVSVVIPDNAKSSNGYKYKIEKTNDDSDSSKIQDAISFVGWDEIKNSKQLYPRTALLGFALKSQAEYSGSIPTVTSLIKGLIIKVPSNYNQPILSTGEIDWREVETPASGANSYTVCGYNLESPGAATLLTEANPIIYKGAWDGTFVYKWTQNPVWVLYDLLTNQSYGLGIPEGNIDKFKFFKVAQYCDAVNPKTGRFIGVTGFADGTFRHKPRGKFTSVRQNQIGIDLGTSVIERRFTCNISINTQKQVMDIINQVSAIFRGILFYNGGKISINVDLPDEIPVAIYNETNILKSSLTISGMKESELLTGVEVSYLEPRNHSRRELVRIDDPKAISELNSIENVKSVDLPGCDRRSQAIRFAQYLLASSKYVRRKATFKTPAEGMTSTIGDVIALSQRVGGISYGYGGRIFANSSVASANVILEHFTSPAITASVITGNTKPIALRVINRETDRVELYICQNTFGSVSSSNVNAGIDIIELTVSKIYKPQTRTFVAIGNFTANNVPIKADIWSLGEVDPSNYYTHTNDKLFKIINVERDTDEIVSITATEYVSNVYVDSDSIISYVPVKYTDTANPLVAPPAPVLNIVPRPIKQLDGSVQYDLDVYTATDTTGYPVAISTELQISRPSEIMTIQGIS